MKQELICIELRNFIAVHFEAIPYNCHFFYTDTIFGK